MRNEYPGQCCHCRCRVPAGAGVLQRVRRRLVLYCEAHKDEAFTLAQRWARDAAAPAEDEPIERSFADGSVARWTAGKVWCPI